MLGLGLGIEHQHDTRLHIGMFHQGGIIFYLDGGSGFICTVSDIADASSPAEWGCQGTEIDGADLPSIGAGAQNTIDINADCTTADIAADLCRDLNLNGYTDWYLPSKNELNAMYGNLVDSGILTTGWCYWYWSSTESSTTKAWAQVFLDTYGTIGNQGEVNKSTVMCVRAIRAF